jgi:hypothetical protein
MMTTEDAPAPEKLPDPPYWCAKQGLDLASASMDRVKRFYSQLVETVMWRRWVKAYRIVYGLSGLEDPHDVSRAASAGAEGELVAAKINHVGSIKRRALSLVSQTVPDFEPVPINTDSKSLEQVDFTKNLLNYCMDLKGVREKLYDTADAASIFGLAWLATLWDPRAGATLKPDQLDPMVPEKTKTGDLSFKTYDPLDVVINRFRFDQEHDWMITRDWVNRYDVAARYPALSDQIVELKSEFSREQSTSTNSIEAERSLGSSEEAKELIPLWTLYHRRSDALPNGKIAMFLSSDIMLYEGGLPYREVPLTPICPGKMLRTPYGDAPLHHILGLQDLYDNIASAVSTNNVAFATQVVMVPDEADYSYKEVAKGLAILRYSAGVDGKQKPEGLNLTAPNGEALNFLKLLLQEMETISGISATLRGTPQANIQSGSYAALVAQQALEYLGAFQYSFQTAVSKTGNQIVQVLKQYADVPLMALIAGKSKAYEARSYDKNDLENIDRVVVRSGNPAARTAQFALAAADALLSKNLIDKKEYLLLQRTGSLEATVDQAEAATLNLRRENELIAAGTKPICNSLDAHRDHILGHANELASPSARENPTAQEAGLAHIQEHITALRTVDPALLNLIGQTPLPPAPSPPVEPGAPQGTPPGPQMPPGMPGAQPGPDPHPPMPPNGNGQLPRLPSMPTNPLTQRPASPTDGSIHN